MDVIKELRAALAKATERPWFVHDFTSASDSPTFNDVTISCTTPDHITVAYMGGGLKHTCEEARDTAAAIVAIMNRAERLLDVVEAAQKEDFGGSPVPKSISDALAALQAGEKTK